MNRTLDIRHIEVVDPMIAEILRNKTPAERVAMISSNHRTMRLLIEGHLRTYHRDWTDSQIFAEIARRLTLGSRFSGAENVPCGGEGIE